MGVKAAKRSNDGRALVHSHKLERRTVRQDGAKAIGTTRADRTERRTPHWWFFPLHKVVRTGRAVVSCIRRPDQLVPASGGVRHGHATASASSPVTTGPDEIPSTVMSSSTKAASIDLDAGNGTYEQLWDVRPDRPCTPTYQPPPSLPITSFIVLIWTCFAPFVSLTNSLTLVAGPVRHPRQAAQTCVRYLIHTRFRYRQSHSAMPGVRWLCSSSISEYAEIRKGRVGRV